MNTVYNAALLLGGAMVCGFGATIGVAIACEFAKWPRFSRSPGAHDIARSLAAVPLCRERLDSTEDDDEHKAIIIDHAAKFDKVIESARKALTHDR